MRKFCKLFESLRSDERGLSTVEYVIILVLVAVLGIGVWRTLGATIRGQVESSDSALKSLATGDGSTQSGG